MKKLSFSLILALVLGMVLLVGKPVDARNGRPGITPPDSVLREVAPCNNGFHEMHGKGWGTVRNTSQKVLFHGQAWQCIKCYHGLVTEGNPTYKPPQKIGRYAGAYWQEPVPSGHMTIYANSYRYANGTKLPGYRFR